jgi:hypothetical protein
LDLTSGSENIFIGKSAGANITTASSNTVIGYSALELATTAANNVVIGTGASYAVPADVALTGCVSIGQNALRGASITTAANYTVAIGSGALQLNTSGAGNVAIGYNAGTALTNSHNNTIIGYGAFDAANNGMSNNVVIGYQAGGAMADQTTSDDNVIIGMEAGTGGTGEVKGVVVIGRDAMKTTGSNAQEGTVAIGHSALTALTSGASNVAVGYQSGLSLTTGVDNAFFGHAAGDGTDDGVRNTAIGRASLSANAADDNTAVGYDSLGATTGSDNTGVGSFAGNTITTGGENTLIGYNTDVSASGSTNQIVIGNNITGTADNAVHIGNDTSHIRCDFNTDQTWDASSDRRQKKDIKESELGLDFINDLKPCKYKYKSPSEFPEEWKAHNPDDKEPMGGSDKYYYGFIAQEVKESIDKYDASDYGAWNVDDDGRQRVSREQFVVSLVKAVQELSAEVKSLKQQLEDK